MIVTCPNCTSKYRVRDEAVPPEGAELQCPTCQSVFLAQRPQVNIGEVTAVLEKQKRARDELEKTLQSRDAEIVRLTLELERARGAGGGGDELRTAREALLHEQRARRSLQAELDVANQLIASLQAEVGVLRGGAASSTRVASDKRIEELQGELQSLRAQLSSLRSEVPTGQQALIAAIGPMLWGLEQSIKYLEQFSSTEPTLAGHVKQLHLLQGVLRRLTAEVDKR